MDLVIPTAMRDRVAVVLQISPRDLHEISVALADVKPTLKRLPFVSAVQKAAGLDPARAADVVEVLLSWFYLRADAGLTGEEVVRDLEAAARRTTDERVWEGWSERREALTAILSLDNTIGVTAKSAFLASQGPNAFERVRIFTDIRPVFASNAVEAPGAFVAVHTVKIAALGRDGRRETSYFTFDGDDLKTLQACVQRAIEKEDVLNSWMASKGAELLS
jgi:hypothetical protein